VTHFSRSPGFQGLGSWSDTDLLSVTQDWSFRYQLPIREICRRTGLSRNTIKKYLQSYEVRLQFGAMGRPSRVDLVIPNQGVQQPLNASGGALLFHLLSQLYERTSLASTTNLSCSEWGEVFGDAKAKPPSGSSHGSVGNS